MLKKMLLIITIFTACSCQRDYNCVCTKVPSQQDTIVDHIKTTRLGSNGYVKTCRAFEERDARLTQCTVK